MKNKTTMLQTGGFEFNVLDFCILDLFDYKCVLDFDIRISDLNSDCLCLGGRYIRIRIRGLSSKDAKNTKNGEKNLTTKNA